MKTGYAKITSGAWLAWVFLAAGLFAATIAYWQGREMVARELFSQLDFRSKEVEYGLRGQVDIYTEVLKGLQAQFVANPNLSRRAFHRIGASMNVQSRLRGIQALGFTQRVAAREVPAFEAAMKSELSKDDVGYPAPMVHPAPTTADAFVVQYVEPITHNPAGAWFDQGSELKRRTAIEQARDTGTWSVSGRVRLSVAPGNLDGVIFFLPVYRGNPGDLTQRRAAFLGAVFLVVRIDEMLRNVFGPTLLNDLDVEIFEQPGAGTAAATHLPENLIFDSGGYQDVAYLHAGSRAFPLSKERMLQFGDNRWLMVVTALSSLASHSQYWLPPIAGLAGLLLSLLGFFFIQTLYYARKAADARAREVEHNLHSKETQLANVTESISEVLWTLSLPSGELTYVSVAIEKVYGRPVAAFYADPHLWIECIHPLDRRQMTGLATSIVEQGQAILQFRIIRADGEVRWIRYEVHFIAGETPGSGRIDGVGGDVTAQRKLEESLRRSNRALRAIHACEEVIAKAEHENGLLQGICEVMVEAGYRMAWAGIVSPDSAGGVLPLGIAGHDEGYLDCIADSLAAGVSGIGTIGEALRLRRPAIINRLDNNEKDRGTGAAQPNREALWRGFNSKIALPLLPDEGVAGILNVYAAEQDAFDAEEVNLLAGLAQSVTVALQAQRNRSGRQAAEAALRLRKLAIEASANAILITSAQAPDYAVEYVNPAFESMTGYASSDIVGKSLRLLHREDHDQPGLEEIRTIIKEQRKGHSVVRNYRKDGTMFWSDVYIAPVRDDRGVVTHFVTAKYDVTETKRYQAELEFQVNRDTLTGLANRNLLHDRLRQAIAYADRYRQTIWMVLIDLDHFKFVNDTLGHAVGDLLLKQIGHRLQDVVRVTDTVARLGGDEFAVILSEHTDESPDTRLVQRIMDAVAQPMTIENHDFFLTCSAGIAVYPADGADTDGLLKHAEIAMYRGKETGRSNFQFYAPAMNERALERLQTESDMRNALERNEFVLYYQPQVDLRSGQVIGMEALIRWQHPTRGMVPPDRFIGMAEETGLIVPIGAWVLDTACRQCKQWQAAGHGNLRVAVNLSARQFGQKDLVQSVADVLAASGLDPQYLEIELTESLLMAEVERTIDILRGLKALGVKLSVDDFGTGYSSLSYLKRFPIDVLKIDRSFVQDITTDSDDAAIVVSIISLAHSLRLHVIAEGVETAAQLAYLTHHECDLMQGYYFSRPVAGDAFEQMLVQGKSLDREVEGAAAQVRTLLPIDH